MNFYPLLEENKLSDFPTEPHNNEIEILFPGEQPKNDKYIVISILEIVNFEEEPFDSLIQRIQKKAQEQGLDAVIILEEKQIKRIKNDNNLSASLLELSSNADTSIIKNAEGISGVGIKYKENVDYLEKFVKSKDIYINTSSKEKFILNGSIFVDFKGNDTRTATKKRQGIEHYKKFIKAYSYQFLAAEINEYWSYKNNSKGDVVRRIFVNDEGFPELKCTFEYDYDNRLALIVIKKMSVSFNSENEIVEFYYDEQNRLIEQTILTQSNEELRIYFEYDSSGKLTEGILQRMKGNREVPFIKVVYNYYTSDDVNQF